MAGNPYWCSDIGGFQNDPTDDILARWFEAGTFFPIFRIHGSRNTEIYNMSTTVKPIALAFDVLRYRLMPYIYSLAWKVTNEGYTITRALPFDYPGDANVINIANQFMFGPALLINPVVTSGVTSRSVYLPAGTWYDFWTGTANVNTAGRTVTASAPLSILPIYAKAGAILPMGSKIQYATQKQADTIELRVYPGADGSFTLYEDEGDNYNYEAGTYSTIPISYSNSTGKVTIGARTGSFTGMLTNRIFNIVFVSPGHGIADTITLNPDCVIAYSGTQVTGCTSGIVQQGGTESFNRPMALSTTVTTANGRIVLDRKYSGLQKSVSVYNCVGKLLATKTLNKNDINLAGDFNIPTGVYIVKIKTLP
jgi:alpha-D-xyloside xylohydrolase